MQAICIGWQTDNTPAAVQRGIDAFFDLVNFREEYLITMLSMHATPSYDAKALIKIFARERNECYLTLIEIIKQHNEKNLLVLNELVENFVGTYSATAKDQEKQLLKAAKLLLNNSAPYHVFDLAAELEKFTSQINEIMHYYIKASLQSTAHIIDSVSSSTPTALLFTKELTAQPNIIDPPFDMDITLREPIIGYFDDGFLTELLSLHNHSINYGKYTEILAILAKMLTAHSWHAEELVKGSHRKMALTSPNKITFTLPLWDHVVASEWYLITFTRQLRKTLNALGLTPENISQQLAPFRRGLTSK